MKKRFLAVLIAALMLAVLQAGPALAENELTNTSQSGDTEVDALIEDGTGEVAYIVTVPSKIDFGNLVCPDTNEDSFTIQKFTVSCDEMVGVNKVQLSVCNDGSTSGELNQEFFLTNQTNKSCTFKPLYEVYVGTTKINTSEAMPVNGYEYLTFTQKGQAITGGVRLNQAQLFPYKDNIAEIAGQYSGRMVFTTAAIA